MLVDSTLTKSITQTKAEVGKGLRERWGPVASRLTLYATYQADAAVWPEVIDALRS